MQWPGDGTLIATCGGGAEHALEEELTRLGLRPTGHANGIVRFPGRAEEAATANFNSRIASRILVPVGGGRVSSYDDLYRLARSLPWRALVPPDLTIAVGATTRDRRLPDSRLAALRVKDAVVDAQRSGGNHARSSVDRRHPDVPIVLFVEDGAAELSLDTSGAPLHERGYRREAGEAPLRETVAATMIATSGWTPEAAFCDPFCGSGTIAIEAAMIALGIEPAGVRERYAMERWPWFPATALASRRPAERAKTEGALTGPSAPLPRIVARDADPGVIEIARRNARRAGVEEVIEFALADALSTPAPFDAGVVVTNPPYGERMELEEARGFYASLGSHLKSSYGGWNVWLLSANREAMKGFGLRPSSKMQLYNGGLDARLYHFEIYPKRPA